MMNLKRRPVHLIAAVDNKGGFSKNGDIPWYIPEDFKHFKDITTGNLCLMGRVTYEDINKRTKNETNVLPNRRSFVVSNTIESLPNATIVKELNDIDFNVGPEDNDTAVYVIGGEKLYDRYIALAIYVHLTVINEDFECDRFFPVDYLMKHFNLVNVRNCESDPKVKFFTYLHNKYTQR